MQYLDLDYLEYAGLFKLFTFLYLKSNTYEINYLNKWSSWSFNCGNNSFQV